MQAGAAQSLNNEKENTHRIFSSVSPSPPAAVPMAGTLVIRLELRNLSAHGMCRKHVSGAHPNPGCFHGREKERKREREQACACVSAWARKRQLRGGVRSGVRSGVLWRQWRWGNGTMRCAPCIAHVMTVSYASN